MKLGVLGNEKILLDPDGFNIAQFEVAYEERTASGRLVKDIVAIKRQFTLSFESFTSEDTNHIKDLINLGVPLSFLYDDAEREEQAIVYIKSYPRDLYKYDYDYSQNITIVLEEV